MNDLVREIVVTDRQTHDRGAMRATRARAAYSSRSPRIDVCARDGVVLNPHYKGDGQSVRVGILDLPAAAPRRRRGGAAPSTQRRLPIGVRAGGAIGLVDAHFGVVTARRSARRSRARARALAADLGLRSRCWTEKHARRAGRRGRASPLAAYRAEELERMRLNFFGFDSSYHVARYHFVAQGAALAHALWIARHRALAQPA